MLHWLQWCVVFFITFCSIGCCTTQNTTEQILDVISVTPASGSVLSEHLFPPVQTPRVFSRASDTGDEQQVIRTHQPTKRFQAQWVSRDRSENGDDLRTEFRRMETDGSIVMTAVIEHAEHAITFFDPPLIIVPPELLAGKVHQQTVSMRVMSERNPMRQRESGTGTQAMEYVDDSVLRLPFGIVKTKRIVIQFHADLRFADADTTITLYVEPLMGIVAEERLEKITILGVMPRTSRETLWLIE